MGHVLYSTGSLILARPYPQYQAFIKPLDGLMSFSPGEDRCSRASRPSCSRKVPQRHTFPYKKSTYGSQEFAKQGNDFSDVSDVRYISPRLRTDAELNELIKGVCPEFGQDSCSLPVE